MVDSTEQSQEKLQEVNRIVEAVNLAYPSFEERWKMQRKGYDYLRSEQYTRDQKAYYDGLKRPTNVFNAMFEKFNFVLGDHFLSDQRQRVYARANADPKVAEVVENHLDHVHTENDYRYEAGRTLMAGWLGGGFTFLRYSNERDYLGSMVYGNEDEYGIMWDPRSTHYFFDDAKWVCRQPWMTTSDILAVSKWPGKKIKHLLEESKKSDFTWGEDWQLRNANDPKYGDFQQGRYKVIEFHEIRRERTEIVILPSGDSHVLSFNDPKRRDLYLKAHPGAQVVEKMAKVKYVHTVLPALSYLLETRKADTQDGTYDIIGYWPYPFARKTIDFFGMMQVVVGPQDFLNDMHNRTLDLMNKTANAPIEYVPEAYENPEDIANYGNVPGLRMMKDAKFVGRETFKQHEPPRLPMDSVTMANEAKAFIEVVTASDEQTGRELDANSPASRYAQQVAQGQVKFAVPKYMWNNYKRRLNNKILAMVQANTPMNHILKIQDPSGMQNRVMVNIQAGKEIMNNLTVGEYEVVIDSADRNPTATFVRSQQKRDFFGNILVPVFGPQMAGQILDWDWFLKDSDMGDMQSQIDRIKQALMASGQAQSEQDALMRANAIIDTVKKNVDLQDPGSPATAAPMKNKQMAETP